VAALATDQEIYEDRAMTTPADHAKALASAVEEAIEALESMDLHIDNSLYDRLRTALEAYDAAHHEPPATQPTPLQASAVTFVAALSEHVDKQRGIDVPNGTRDTQKRVAAIVRERHFAPPSPPATGGDVEGIAAELVSAIQGAYDLSDARGISERILRSVQAATDEQLYQCRFGFESTLAREDVYRLAIKTIAAAIRQSASEGKGTDNG
jgi:hypothetical protein